MKAQDVAQILSGASSEAKRGNGHASWTTIPEVGELPDYQEGLPAITTGYQVLDTILGGGFRTESSYVIGGRTGTSKSTLALNIARRSALAGNCVLVFKLEESIREAVYRMHAATSQIPFNWLLNGSKSLSGINREKLDDGWELLRALPIRMSDQRELARIREISTRHVAEGGRLIIIDQLSMIIVPNTDAGYERATAISNEIRILARDLHVPILTLVQVNREAAKKKREILGVNDLRDSGAIENDASAVILIDRVRRPKGPIYGDSEFVRYLRLVVPKNRYGPAIEKPFELEWRPRLCRIDDYDGPCPDEDEP